MTKRSKSYLAPTEQEILCCAYAIYAQENPESAFETRRQAEAQLIADRKHDAGLMPVRPMRAKRTQPLRSLL